MVFSGFWQIGRLCVFRGFGTAQGSFEVQGYGFQEAFVVGWSFRKLQAGTDSIPNEVLRNRAVAYRQVILNNEVLNRLENGKVVKVVDSRSLSQKQVRTEFLDAFFDPATEVRAKIDGAQSAVRSNLANLCVPGEIKVVGQMSCYDDYYVYQKSAVDLVRVCGANMKLGSTVLASTCGNVIRTKDTGL